MTDQVIFDRGYRKYEGERSGPAGARKAVYKDGLRRIVGLGRKARYKIFPWSLISIAIIASAVRVTTLAGNARSTTVSLWCCVDGRPDYVRNQPLCGPQIPVSCRTIWRVWGGGSDGTTRVARAQSPLSTPRGSRPRALGPSGALGPVNWENATDLRVRFGFYVHAFLPTTHLRQPRRSLVVMLRLVRRS